MNECPIKIVDLNKRDRERIRRLLETIGVKGTPEHCDQLLQAVSPFPSEDRELIGRLIDHIEIDWDAAGLNRTFHMANLARKWRDAAPSERRGIEFKMMLATKGLDDHPEDWNFPCLCDTCLSYGD